MDARGRTRLGVIGVALFYGALWGLAEATLGHLLHLVHVPGVPGLVMVPIAVAAMGRAALRSRSAGAVFLAGVAAASFKLLDLLVPGTDILGLSRPIQAILLEALAGAAGARFFLKGLTPIGDGLSSESSVEDRKRPHFLTTGRA